MRKNYPCLFCLSFDGPFISEEHILPRGLGNNLQVLPPGIVCDRCNNGVLSKLDETLTNFDPVKFLRTINGIRNRNGTVPAVKQNNLDIIPVGSNHLNVVMKTKKADHFKPKKGGFDLTVVGSRKLTNKYLKKVIRSLYKMGLEMIYSDLGARTAYAKRFNEIRKIVLGEQDFSGSIAILKNPKVQQTAIARHHTRIVGRKKISIFEFYYYGMHIFFGLEIRDFKYMDQVPEGIFDVISVHKGK